MIKPTTQTIINPAFTKSKYFTWLAIAVLFSLCFFCYANSIGNEMFWDDDDFILKNRFIKSFAFWPVWFSDNVVAGSYFVSNYWRPLLLSVFATEWHFWQNSVYGWHIVSILFHTIDGVLLYFLLSRLFNHRLLAIICAILFVIHPAHNEVVVYVNSLGDSLATFFVLSGMILYARFRHSQKNALMARNYYFSLFCFILAVLSKETGFVLFALIPLMDFLLLSTGTFWQRVKKVFCATWPLISLAIIYILLRATVLNFSSSFNFYHDEVNAFTSSIWIRLFTFFKAVTQYAGFIFCPYELRVERQLQWANGSLELDVLWGGFIVLSLLIAAFYFWRRKPIISFGIGFFFLSIAPTSNVLVPINATLYEHFLYMPIIGILLITVHSGLLLCNYPLVRILLSVILIGYISFFCFMNINRNKDWHTAVGFYEQLVNYSPSYRVINNLGMEWADIGDHKHAEYWYNLAIRMDPKNPVAYHNIGGTYRDTNRIDQSIRAFEKAIELNPRFLFSYKSLAELYWRLNDFKKVEYYLLESLKIDPTDRNIQNALTQVRGYLATKQKSY